MALTRDDDGVNDRGALASIGMTNEEPVLFPDGRGPDGVLDEVIVDTGERVVVVRDEHFPVVQQVRARFPELGLKPGKTLETLEPIDKLTRDVLEQNDE